MTKVYLGDSVYASFDGYTTTLTTENGLGASNTIHFEPWVMAKLVIFVAGLPGPQDTNPQGETK